jgi:hypothetical protein
MSAEFLQFVHDRNGARLYELIQAVWIFQTWYDPAIRSGGAKGNQKQYSLHRGMVVI